ncbi:MAG TPA: phBC6A51 family helix-turn-helix protein [Candidatus Binatia bacterium]|nr:phBC6A51 family helix-turn-helix protein [Candidatus Binatia bacterium]
MMRNETEHFGTLSSRQRRAIEALLLHPTLEEAAKAAKIGKTTLYRWLKEDAFSRAVHEARREQSQEALACLRSSLLRAVHKLSELLNSGNEMIAFRAATALVEHGLKGIELEEQEERIGELEALVTTLQQRGLGR